MGTLQVMIDLPYEGERSMQSSLATWHLRFNTPGNTGGTLTNGRLAQQVANTLHLLGSFATVQQVRVDRTGQDAAYVSQQAARRATPALLGYLRCHDDVTAVHVTLDLRVLEPTAGGFDEVVLPGAAILTIASLGDETSLAADGMLQLALHTDAHCETCNRPLLGGFLKRLSRRMPATLTWTESDGYEADLDGLIEALPLAVGQ